MRDASVGEEARERVRVGRAHAAQVEMCMPRMDARRRVDELAHRPARLDAGHGRRGRDTERRGSLDIGGDRSVTKALQRLRERGRAASARCQLIVEHARERDAKQALRFRVLAPDGT